MKKKKHSHHCDRLLSEDCHQPSLFGFYVRASMIAAKLGIGLEYAFRRYVKPSILEDASLMAFTSDEYRACFPEECGEALSQQTDAPS